MPISAAGSKPALRDTDDERGFTLVELMIVVTIIGLASAAVVLAMPDPRGRLADEAYRFAARTRAAHDMALVEGRPVSVWVTGGGYGFDRRQARTWVPISDKPLRVERWADGTRAGIVDPTGRVRITFDSMGLADAPVDLRLTRDRSAAVVHVEADGSVRVDG